LLSYKRLFVNLLHNPKNELPMQKFILLFSFVLIGFISFSQKITITDFSPQQWTNVYEDDNMQFFYKYADSSSDVEKGRKFILFKVKNKTNSELVLNINAVMEYNNMEQSFSNNKTFKINANSFLEGKTTGDANIRLPYEKFRDSEKTLKSLKLDF